MLQKGQKGPEKLSAHLRGNKEQVRKAKARGPTNEFGDIFDPSQVLAPRFYQQKTERVARLLLGQVLYHQQGSRVTSGIIIETEAYLGATDPASHTFGGRTTERVKSMYKEGGHAYVYLIYGLHSCFNVVTRTTREGEAVLIRALFPLLGQDLMRKRRGQDKSRGIQNLCSGPGKLCQAMGIDRTCDGLSLQGPDLWIGHGLHFRQIKPLLQRGPRIGIDYSGHAKLWPLRFFLDHQEVAVRFIK